MASFSFYLLSFVLHFFFSFYMLFAYKILSLLVGMLLRPSLVALPHSLFIVISLSFISLYAHIHLHDLRSYTACCCWLSFNVSWCRIWNGCPWNFLYNNQNAKVHIYGFVLLFCSLFFIFMFVVGIVIRKKKYWETTTITKWVCCATICYCHKLVATSVWFFL